MERYHIKFVNEDGTWGVFDRQTALPFAWFSNKTNAENYVYSMNYPGDS